MTKKFYQKLGPYISEGEENNKDINPNKARNYVIIWYSFIAFSVTMYLIFS